MKLIQFNRNIKSRSIRHRIDIINIIINACEMIILNQFSDHIDINDLEHNQYPFLLINNMSRLFIFEDNKFFSIAFPFQINIEKHQVTFLSIPIALGTLSIINSVLNDFDERNSIVKLTDSIFDNEEYNGLLKEEQQTIEELIEYLLSYEAGYVRYDYDPTNFKKYSEKGNPKVHPLNHLDINYTSNATYKIGLKTSINIKDFLDCLDSTTDSWFIGKT